MTPLILRQVWDLVETSQASMLLNLDDQTLIQWLVRQFNRRQCLSSDENALVENYLSTKLPLIRDMAQERMLPACFG